jgi:DNA-binding winged helix-turn-helix (wHTH) protein/alpha-beta hydrolase superfamily lysophospholipase
MRYAFADCELDTDALSLTRGGVGVPLEPQVFDLLRLLVENADRLVTKDEIIDTVWQGRIVSDSAISARIASARKAVGCDGKTQSVIATVARRGLKLVAQVKTNGAPLASDPAARRAPPRIRYTATPEGHSLAYALSGAGLPVMRSNPVIASDLEREWHVDGIWQGLEAISGQNTLLRFDTLGVGCSGREGGTKDPAAQAEHMRMVADAAGLERFAIYSESGGCKRAITFAARYPDRVSRLAMIGGYVDGPMRRATSPKTEPIRSLIESGWDDVRGGMASAYLLSYFPDGPLESVRDMVAMMQQSTPKAFALANRDAINTASIAHLLPQVQCPTLVIHARDDAVHPLSEARKMAAGIAGAELVVLEGANHMPLPGTAVFQPYLDALLPFLADGTSATKPD